MLLFFKWISKNVVTYRNKDTILVLSFNFKKRTISKNFKKYYFKIEKK